MQHIIDSIIDGIAFSQRLKQQHCCSFRPFENAFVELVLIEIVSGRIYERTKTTTMLEFLPVQERRKQKQCCSFGPTKTTTMVLFSSVNA